MAFISTSRRHLDLLRMATAADFPKKVYAGQTFRGEEIDFALYRDLFAERLVDAKQIDDKTFGHRGVHEKGYKTLEQHRAEATSMGWLRANRTWLVQQAVRAFMTIAISIATTLIVLWLKGIDGQ